MTEQNITARFLALTVLAVFLISLVAIQGCTLRTRNGLEYKITLPPKEKEQKPPAQQEQQPQEQPSKTTNDFAVLTPSEQEKLVQQQNQADMEEKPDTTELVKPDGPPDDFPTTIRSKPKMELPLQATLYTVPGSAEIVMFDPDAKKSSNRKAALELTNQGMVALESLKIELAIAKFQKAISVDPNSGVSYFYFARARFVQKDWDQVIGLSDKATDLLTKHHVYLSRAFLLKAQALANQKRYAPALAACEQAIDADSTNVQAKLLKNRIKSLF